MKSNIKKIIAVLAVFGTFGGYVISQKMSDDEIIPETLNTTPAVPSTPAPVVVPVTVPTKPTSKTTAAFKNGTYTGTVADAYYGPVQVQAVIQNGKLTDVVFLQHPNDRGTSIRINNMAMPRLTSEAISVQSAKVNAVSGASETSRAFVESLQDALNQAKNV